MKASRPGQAHSHLMVRWWLCGLLVLVGASTYVNSLRGPFIFDDIPMIVERRDIRSLADWSHVLGGTNRALITNSLEAGRVCLSLAPGKTACGID